MLVKVCGTADQEFLHRIDEMQIDFIGFIFYQRSKRCIADKIPANQILSISKHIKKVGVFVNEKIENIIDIANNYHLDFIQLHGDEDISFVNQLSKKTQIIKAFRIDKDFKFEKITPYESDCAYFLFDTRDQLYGGTGKKFKWELLQNYKGNTPFFLSGGITPKDTQQIIEFNHPMFMGIDINSGFEIEPGVKDINRIKIFLNHLT